MKAVTSQSRHILRPVCADSQACAVFRGHYSSDRSAVTRTSVGWLIHIWAAPVWFHTVGGARTRGRKRFVGSEAYTSQKLSVSESVDRLLEVPHNTLRISWMAR